MHFQAQLSKFLLIKISYIFSQKTVLKKFHISYHTFFLYFKKWNFLAKDFLKKKKCFSYISGNWLFLSLRLKAFLYFFRKKLFLCWKKRNFVSLRLKHNSKNKQILIFWEMELCSLEFKKLGRPKKQKLLIFQDNLIFSVRRTFQA